MTCRNLTAVVDRRSPTLAAWFAEKAASLWHTYLGRRAKRATVNILQSLDARTLKDIGIDPSEIESLVYGKPHDRLRRYRETSSE